MDRNNFVRKEAHNIYEEVIPAFRIPAVIITIFIIFWYGNELWSYHGYVVAYLVAYTFFSVAVLAFKHWGKRFSLTYPQLVMLIDTALVSCYILMSGGAASSFFLFYILLLIFFSFANNLFNTVLGGLMCAAFYCISVLLIDGNITKPVIFRMLFFLVISFFVSIVNEKIFNHAYTMAMQDGMTSLYNYKYFCNCLEHYIRCSERDNSQTALILIDVDDFKYHNDKKGHLEGDRLLKAISRVIKENIRTNDIASRYGGDEFALVLPGTGRDTAVAICERIREKINQAFEADEQKPVTVSMGIAIWPEDGKSSNELFKAADEALYKAKESGKNTVVHK